ncbi:MAG: peroxiredoxin [Crocinitomicaceae bacterium]|nr:peroxiredoxin [Crocinitomicaceae bacterium]|tara:strand:+ start:1925 stop:2383 length:459 start_codon:yes stop_codon:yes gene_type:complete
MNLDIGDIFPDFTLKDENNNDFTLSENLNDQHFVVYFYPKDETPGCVKQACHFRDSYEEFLKFNCKVIGVSGDSVESHLNFKNKNNLPFTLLSDNKNILRNKIGIPNDFLGLVPGRQTFLLKKTGEIIFTFHSSINMKRHIDEALSTLKKMS